ncbi:MAG: heme-binding domain-containing protein [Candidatus Omnitrophica bacterium]|nr:heme-binding domain-containing protein [Candidatus Omnitrophota bacterium]
MKKVFSAIVVLAFLGLLLPLSNFFWSPPSDTALSAAAKGDVQHLQVAKILEQKCGICHGLEGVLPFYARLPGARQLIERDMEEGAEYFDLLKSFVPKQNQAVGQVALAKLESVVEDGSMPPLQYLAMHWNHGLSVAEKQLMLGWIKGVRAENYASPNVDEEFKGEVIQPLYMPKGLNKQKIALGKKLFNDPRLSADNTLSCASCHSLSKGGTDQLRSSTGVGGAVGPINSPTVFNSGFQFKQFWDGRAADLEEQADGPVHNPIEMGTNWKEVLAKLNQDEAFVQEFTAVYLDGLKGPNIQDAIAEFERSLVTLNSDFDQYLMGKKDVLSSRELEGFHLFKAKGCTSCHMGVLAGGQSFEKFGVRENYFADRGNITEADYGRYNVTKKEEDRFKFKVPTLRNIEVTYPYFHDGSTSDLKDAVFVMGRYQTVAGLTGEESGKIAEFLRTLTGEYQGKKLQ